MKVSVSLDHTHERRALELFRPTKTKSFLSIEYVLENDDTREAYSFNNKQPIRLMANRCTFEFEFRIDMPHPDQLAFAALKILSPFIGSQLKMDRDVSPEFANAVKREYSNITEINSSPNQKPLSRSSTSNIGLAFSGGSDSIAASYILPRNKTKLISLIRKDHPDLGVLEPWHNGNEVGDVLPTMSDSFDKISVYTDFPYTSLNETKNHVIWADKVWHSVPVVLLAQHFELSGLSQGNIMAAFTGNERRFAEPQVPKHHQELFGALNLTSIQPLAGASEFISETIVRENNHKGETLTCNFGPFRKPCMRCVKCFRKSFINHILDGTKPSQQEIDRFNKSKRIQILSQKDFVPFKATLKYMFLELDMKFDGYVGEIQSKVMKSYSDDPSWVRHIYQPFYGTNSQNQSFLEKLKAYAEPMSEEQLATVRRLKVSTE